MIRAVLDTNVLASAAIAHPGTTLATILDSFVANRFELAVSEHILVELRRTLASPYYAARITPAAAGRYVQLTIINGGGYTKDPKSSPVLARKPTKRPGRYCIRLSR